MRWALLTIALTGTLLAKVTACDQEYDAIAANPNTERSYRITDTTTPKMKITIGSKIFRATLLDNAAAKAFRSLLPITMKMTELNGNEKYFNLPTNLPANASKPENIQTGELMLWGTNTIVLFYKNFPTSYSYTKLGQIDNTEGLAAALGSSNVGVTFELDEKTGN